MFSWSFVHQTFTWVFSSHLSNWENITFKQMVMPIENSDQIKWYTT